MDKPEVMENLLVIIGMMAAIEATTLYGLPKLYNNTKTITEVMTDIVQYVERSVDLEKYLKEEHTPKLVIDFGKSTDIVKQLIEDATKNIKCSFCGRRK